MGGGSQARRDTGVSEALWPLRVWPGRMRVETGRMKETIAISLQDLRPLRCTRPANSHPPVRSPAWHSWHRPAAGRLAGCGIIINQRASSQGICELNLRLCVLHWKDMPTTISGYPSISITRHTACFLPLQTTKHFAQRLATVKGEDGCHECLVDLVRRHQDTFA
ncbi:hypothetical protein PCASD_07258 [Puccinia coronata f. sp. avenae]|uniref:Uncharacterized protein n=1 Tax=Puccinia coronata f. sp. avenae TaxID=200324 RepID=A0A2N5UYN0_9BASI|nr:hypothetical protein PCASD_07258 [Puccinia coronata f. sp. avenae]